MNDMTMGVRVAANGRMVLPIAVRRALRLTGEAKVVLTVEGDAVTLRPLSDQVRRAQALYREHAVDGQSVDAFLAERHAGEKQRSGLLDGTSDQ